MPSLNFKAQFASKVSDGSKFHSIRALRKVPFKVGDDLSFFTGMRTKACRRLRINTPCIGATLIDIDALNKRVFLHGPSIIYRAGPLTSIEVMRLAVNDGFDSSAEFFAFFAETHGKGLRGQLVEWKP